MKKWWIFTAKRVDYLSNKKGKKQQKNFLGSKFADIP